MTEPLRESQSIAAQIDVAKGGMIKRTETGLVDFISLVPCPFNYGHVPDTMAGDGAPIDVVVLGKRAARGELVRTTTRACIGFVDAGRDDPKWVAADHPLSRLERFEVESFFRAYAVAKSILNRARGRKGATRFLGWL